MSLKIQDHVRYLLFSEIYLRYNQPKAKRKAFTILEAAIHCFEKKGFENVTLKAIAREVGSTPPLLKHYFTGLDEIRELSLKYIRLVGQKIVVDAIGDANTPAEMLRRYLHGHVYWSQHFKAHIRVWLRFLSYCSVHTVDREMNTMAVSVGKKRIEELLAEGRNLGQFKHQNDQATAKLLQTLMLGWLMSLVTENIADADQFSEEVIHHCLLLVGLN